MTRRSTGARAELIERPGIAYVARFHLSGTPVDFVLSELDLTRDALWCESVLTGHGVVPGDAAIIAALTCESPWFDAARVAVNRSGGTYSNCETRGGDAARLDMYLRRLEPAVVLGLSDALALGLAAIDGALDRLSAVPHLFARPQARTTLAAMGIDAETVVRVGPALGISLADGDGIAVNGERWVVEDEAGQILVSSADGLTGRFRRQPTGLTGRVRTANTIPRLVLTQEDPE